MLSSFYKLLFTCIYLLLAIFTLTGQPLSKVDSLKLQLEETIGNKERVDLYNAIAKESSKTSFVDFEQASKQAIDLASKADYTNGLKEAHYIAGKVYQSRGRLKDAIQNTEKAHQLAIQLNDTTIKAKSLNILGLINMHQGNYDQSLHQFSESLALREQLQDEKGMALVYSNIASVYAAKGDYKQTLAYHEKELNISQKIHYDRGIANALNSMGLIYKSQGKYAKSLSSFVESLTIYEKINYVKGIVATYTNIGILHDIQKNKNKALEYYFKALKLHTEKRAYDKQTLAYIYTNIGIVYRQQKLYSKALEFFFKGLEIKEAYNNRPSMIYSYENIGLCYFEQKNNDKALEYLEKGLALSNEIGSKTTSAISLFALGKLYTLTKNYPKAEEYLLKAYHLAKQIGEPVIRTNCVQYLAIIDKARGNFQSALSYHISFKHLSDSLFNVKQAEIIADINTKYETEKKEQQIKSLEQNAKIKDLQLRQSSLYLVVLSVVFILFVLIGVIVYLFARQKQFQLQKKHHEVEQKLLRVQMNPHFIFNALSVIQKYMFDANSQKASFYLAKFSRLMRQVLNHSRHEYISLEEEIAMLDNYLSLQNLRQKQPFEYEIVVDEQIDPEEIAIPPMFAQPFVENAIEHGISDLSEQGKIQIHFRLEQDQIILTIQDNGIGIQQATTIKTRSNTKHQSLATQITQERIVIFKQNYKKDVGFKIENLRQGTKVIFHLPYQYL